MRVMTASLVLPLVEGNNVSSYGHDTEGFKLAKDFMAGLTFNKILINGVALLVKEHMQPRFLYKQQSTDSAIRRLSMKAGEYFPDLLLLSEADYKGRAYPKCLGHEKIKDWFAQKMSQRKFQKEEKPLVTGKDLMDLGLQPGPVYKKILSSAFEMQLNGFSLEEIVKQVESKVKGGI